MPERLLNDYEVGLGMAMSQGAGGFKACFLAWDYYCDFYVSIIFGNIEIIHSNTYTGTLHVQVWNLVVTCEPRYWMIYIYISSNNISTCANILSPSCSFSFITSDIFKYRQARVSHAR